MTWWPRRALTIVVAAVALGACGSDRSVGEGVDLNVANEAERAAFGASTTTAPPRAPGPDEGRAAIEDTTTTAPPTTTTTEAPRQVALTIAINSDTSPSTQFDPSSARVFEGSLVEWVNRDSLPRSVVADDGSFRSGSIAPGGTYRFEATQVGSFSYSDGTRPYAVGVLEVVPRG